MNYVMNVFNFFIDAGPTVMLPVIITIIGMIFGIAMFYEVAFLIL